MAAVGRRPAGWEAVARLHQAGGGGMWALRRIFPAGLFVAACVLEIVAPSGTLPASEQAPRPCAGCDVVIHPVLRSRNPEIIASSKVEPRYPRRARRHKAEGQVIIQCVVRRDGTVGDGKVLRVTAPGHGFEEAAVRAVRQWRFVPATFNGEPVDVYFTVVVDFRLDSKSAT